jgi:hypothetical protein
VNHPPSIAETILLVLFTLVLTCAGGMAQTAVYLDPTQPIDTRVDDLLAKMTLEEKVSQDTRHVHLDLGARDLSMVNESGDRIIAAGDYGISVGGGQPGTGAPSVEAKFTVHGQQEPLETPLSPLSSRPPRRAVGAKPTCPGAPWRDLQFHSTRN